MDKKRTYLGKSVFDAALDRLVEVYNEGHKVVCTFSGGKDSGVVLEMAILAARMTGNLPLDVVMRDEEVMFPGTFEYCERVAARPEVRFHWLIAHQPIINVFNRVSPYWWTFDQELDPEQWVRQPPSFAEEAGHHNIETIACPQRFPHAEGKMTIALMGLRAEESPNRNRGLHSSGGWITKRPTAWGQFYGRPIYDWSDSDVWRAIYTNHWDYNEAYNVMNRFGVTRKDLRIAPPTMTTAHVKHLAVAFKAWPRWADKVAERCQGTRSAAHYGMRAVQAQRRLNETWEQCYQRTCIDDAPEWIAKRALAIKKEALKRHARHSTTPFNDVKACYGCHPNMGSWKRLTKVMYLGDPFSLKQDWIPQVDSDYFRPGSGKWGGTPAFG